MIARTIDSLPLSVDSLRNPGYTGKNRYFPCTLANLALATATSVVLTAFAPLAAVSFFGLSLLLIYFRGYLVPGTPILTERYFSDWVHRPPDEHDERDDISTTAPLDDIDTIEGFLRRHDALMTTAEGSLELTPSFRAAHGSRTTGYDDDDRLLADAVSFVVDGLAVEDFDLERRSNAAVIRYDGRSVARWSSRAALVGDVAAAAVFAEWGDDWLALTPETRLQILGALRLWYEWCPVCDGTIALEQDITDDVFHSSPVLTATCDDCGAHVFETGYDDSLTPD